MFGVKNSSNARSEMSHLLQQVQDLYAEAATASGDKADQLRKRGLTLLDSAAHKAQEIGTVARDAGKDVVKSTDHLVHENPWKSMAISGGVGLLIGVLIGRQ